MRWYRKDKHNSSLSIGGWLGRGHSRRVDTRYPESDSAVILQIQDASRFHVILKLLGLRIQPFVLTLKKTAVKSHRRLL